MASKQCQINKTTPPGLIWGQKDVLLVALHCKYKLDPTTNTYTIINKGFFFVFTCDPVMGVVQMGTVVDEQVFNVSEHLVYDL